VCEPGRQPKESEPTDLDQLRRDLEDVIQRLARVPAEKLATTETTNTAERATKCVRSCAEPGNDSGEDGLEDPLRF
jgi:hypothetical protein